MKKKLLIGTIGLIIVVAVVGLGVLVYRSLSEQTPPTGTTITINQKTGVQPRQEVIEKLSEKGRLLFEKRRYQALVATYENVLKAAPDSVDTKKKLAKAYYELGELEKKLGDGAGAEDHMKRARDLDPRPPIGVEGKLRGDDISNKNPAHNK